MRKHNKILEDYIKNGCKGDLDLSESNIESLPDNLEVGGNLNLRDCMNLTAIGDNLKVDGNLNLTDCINLTSLPDNLEVEGNLDLSYCENLTSLPDNLKVGGHLCLYWCQNLTSLPDNLEVGGDIELCFCRNLISLGDNIKVGGDLDLHMTKIKTLPPTLEVKGDVYVDEDFDLEAYIRQAFIKTMEGEPVATIEGEIMILDEDE